MKNILASNYQTFLFAWTADFFGVETVEFYEVVNTGPFPTWAYLGTDRERAESIFAVNKKLNEAEQAKEKRT